jgi:hypothetical protein
MLRSFTRLALGKGIFGGSRPWLIAGVAATGVRLFARMARRQPELVYSETLESGHSLVISHFGRDEA